LFIVFFSFKNSSKHERQSLLDSSIIQLPKSMQQNNESLFMTSIEKARIRNETLLKVIFYYDFYFFLNDYLFYSLFKN